MSDTATTTTLSGRYRLDERIGSGGAGEVWRAYDLALARAVAVKVLHPALQHDESTVQRFKREAAAAAGLNHPNVVVIYDVGHEEDRDYLVMEHVDGAPLATLLAPGPLSPAVVADLGSQVAEALAAAHDIGIIHRDVKPGNIILSREGVAKVADFGIAKAVGEHQSRLTATGTIVGSAAYVAPEQLRDHEIDGRTDVYALGLVLHECLTGQRPFAGGTPAEVAARRLQAELDPPGDLIEGVPPELDEVIVRAIDREPDQRFASAARFAAALHALTTESSRDEITELVDRYAPPIGASTEVLPRDDRYGETAHRASHTIVMGVDDVDGDAVTAPRPKVDTTAEDLAVTPPRRPRRAAAAPAPATGRPDGDDRSGRTRLVTSIVVLLLAAAATVAVLTSGDDGAGGGDAPSTDAPIAITGAGDHDPFGDSEHPEDVPQAYDGNPATAWNTQIYNSADLGGLKDGVGIWFDLGDAGTSAGTLQLTFAQSGSDVTIFSGSSQPQGDPNGWGSAIASQQGVGQQVTFEIPEDGADRYYLVWITRLSGSRTELAEVAFHPR